MAREIGTSAGPGARAPLPEPGPLYGHFVLPLRTDITQTQYIVCIRAFFC